jgi:hypothetical protein
MALNKVQQDFINNAARPHMEEMIRMVHVLDTYIADYNAIQASVDALPIDATILDDAGASPRSDAPQLTGADLANMESFSTSMSAVVGAAAKQVLIGKMVRNLNTVLKLS